MLLPRSEKAPDYGGYAYDFVRQHQNEQFGKTKKNAKMKKRVNKLSAKNRVVRRK